MIYVRTGEKVIDYLTDERRLAERNPDVKEQLNALKDTQNIAEELMYQGAFHQYFPDAWKVGMALASLPMEVYYAIANLHPEWFATIEGKKEFMAWLNRHPGYRYYPANKNIR